MLDEGSGSGSRGVHPGWASSAYLMRTHNLLISRLDARDLEIAVFGSRRRHGECVASAWFETNVRLETDVARYMLAPPRYGSPAGRARTPCVAAPKGCMFLLSYEATPWKARRRRMFRRPPPSRSREAQAGMNPDS
jgi:hypothetical protein